MDDPRTDPPLEAGERAVPPSSLSLLGIVRHMAEVEYARHNGHADLLRERLDGVTGQ